MSATQRKFPGIPELHPDVHSERLGAFFAPRGHLPAPSASVASKEKPDAFLICFTNRCGSNFAAQALASSGQVGEAGENLNFDVVISHATRLGHRSLKEYWEWLGNATRGQANLFGCKVSIGQLIMLWEQEILHSMPSVKLIHIVRDDIIDQAISLHIASKTLQWTSTQQAREVEVKYEPDAIVSIARSIALQNAMFRAFLELSGLQPIVVRYEDLIERPEALTRTMGDHLGVPCLEFRADMVKYQKQAGALNLDFKRQLRRDFSVLPS